MVPKLCEFLCFLCFYVVNHGNTHGKLPPPKVLHQLYYSAYNQRKQNTGSDGEIKGTVFFLNPDIARQAAKKTELVSEKVHHNAGHYYYQAHNYDVSTSGGVHVTKISTQNKVHTNIRFFMALWFKNAQGANRTLTLHQMKKTVKVGDIECGSKDLFLISGPCVIEDEKIMIQTAEKLKEVSERLKIKVIYKSSFLKDNRSSLKYYDGPGLEKGMKILAKVKEQFGFPLLTDIHESYQAEIAGEVCDVLQIPAYLCMQSSLVVAAAKTGKVVNIKHGQFLAPDNMKYPLQKCIETGNDKVILTERGYVFGYNDLIVDPRAFYHLNNLGYPVVFDITHCVRKYGIPSADTKGGNPEFLPVLSRAGVASGVDGVFIETHPEPSKALCDAASQLCVYDLEAFLKPLIAIHELVANTVAR